MHELSKQALVSSGLMNQLRKNGEPQPANKYVLPRPCLFVSAIWLSLKNHIRNHGSAYSFNFGL